MAVLAIALLTGLAVADWLSDGITRSLILGHADLRIDSAPAGASVAIDGASVGVTPLKIAVISGAHVVKLSERFHRDVVERIHFQRGDTVVRQIAFAPSFGRLSVVSNPIGASVSVDGQRLPGETPLSVDNIAAARHVVVVSAPGRRSVTVSRDVLPDALAEVSVELERAVMGELTIRATPSAARVEVLEAGTPYAPAMALPVGTYRVRVTHEGYADEDRQIVVRQGANLEPVTLRRLTGVVEIAVVPSDALVRVASADGTVTYRAGLQLPVGSLTVSAQALGYGSYRKQMKLTAAGLNLTISLRRIDVATGSTIHDALKVGGQAPRLVVVGAGRFTMGDAHGTLSQTPAHDVTVLQPFAIGVDEVTRGEYAAYAAATGAELPRVMHGETAAHPISQIDWEAAMGYAAWLTEQTGHRYRLPTEAEWEFAARAGSTAAYTFGSDPREICAYGNVADAATHAVFRSWEVVDCDDGHVRSAPVGGYRANAFGLHDVHGNVAEWVLDCWHISYAGAPSVATAWDVEGACVDHVVRGGGWQGGADATTVTNRRPASTASDERGFRVVREF